MSGSTMTGCSEQTFMKIERRGAAEHGWSYSGQAGEAGCMPIERMTPST